ncbi:hypothetical protein WA1_27420 [Scytonema hofmannii PCC 7110]|uniref:Uncharacterized protein n=1 Tax=Scytonema hofmannii PCC 7110 TaxID=128403 RepID=A0A139X6G6_9CYAN|nr:hypothetical protein WA1_27420 [Scytonema hofmannii PCC 7110]
MCKGKFIDKYQVFAVYNKFDQNDRLYFITEKYKNAALLRSDYSSNGTNGLVHRINYKWLLDPRLLQEVGDLNQLNPSKLIWQTITCLMTKYFRGFDASG